MSHDVHAPYHFVPLSKWVHMPDWAHQVSHDVPFSDGLSGTIDLTLNTISPLCVGGEQIRKEGTPTAVKWVKSPEGEPVIPGSSLKGMLRSVMEVATFGKFQAVDEQRLSFRDISSSNTYYLKQVIGQSHEQAGWVRYDDAKRVWLFTACQFAKVSHQRIKEDLQIVIKNASSAVDKYEQIGLAREVSANISEPKGKQKNVWAESLGSGANSGHLVFTNERIKGRGKPEDFEFSYFFYGTKSDEVTDVTSLVHTLFANHGEKQVDYLKKNGHPSLGIPVFALRSKQTRQLEHLGFARMPRATYKHSFHDYIEKRNKAHLSDAIFDMTELLFGTLREQGLGLKGRVGFTDAEPAIQAAHKLYMSNPVVLNGPKPSFYPAYLEQQPNTLVDYNSEQTTLSGWKRYVAKVPADELLAPVNQNIKANVSSTLELLPSGTQFKGRLTFHNLRPVELGALLWAIELGQDNNQQQVHSLGHGKPLGAGLVTIQSSLTVVRQARSDAQEYIAEFERYMDEVHPGANERSWFNSPQLEYLRALTTYGDNLDVDTSYMSIDDKEYQVAKNRNSSLPFLHGIERNEETGLIQNEPAMRAFGQGRLAGLVDEANGWEVSKQNEANREAKEQAEQAKLEAMSPCEQALGSLQATLTNEQAQNHPEPMRDTANLFIANADSYSQENAATLYKVLRQNDFHKKPKKRVKEHKVLLSDLAKAYNLSEG